MPLYIFHGLRAFTWMGLHCRNKSPNLKTSWRKRTCVKFLLAFIAMAVLYEVSTCFFPAWNTNPDSNYFKAAKYYENLPTALETLTCTLPDLSGDLESDPSMKKLLQPNEPVNCSKSSPSWTYANGTSVILDHASFGRWDSSDNIKCCYREIKRVEQSPGSYNSSADSLNKVSNSCFPLHAGANEIAVEFIQVECYNSSGKSVYKNYHAVLNASNNALIASKVNRWQTWKAQQLPPNVLILVIDTVSRSNFRRTMKETAKTLVSLGAVELFGYIKVAENTFPNAIPLLSGLTLAELTSKCGDFQYRVQDDCPYIWKDFNSSHYLTAHLEDSPRITAFNSYKKIGFLQQQVDFYNRPLMLQAYGQKLFQDCIGPDRVHDKVLRYLKRVTLMASNLRVPLFSLTWLTNLAHDDLNAPAAADKSFSSFLEDLDLENTILFLMSDHGTRYGSFRRTHYGWYEDKLPNFWLYLPPYLRQQKPSWINSLHLNSKRLSSHFDAYHTLRQILKDIVKSEPSDSHVRTVGQSLFKEISPNRICNDAGVQDEYCPCQHPNRVPVDRNDVKLAVHAAISYMNSQLTPQCAQLSVHEVIAAASSSTNYSNSTKDQDSVIYTVDFIVHPGRHLVEATVKYDKYTNLFLPRKQLTLLGRVGQANFPKCVTDPKAPYYCYCL